jgi:acetoacetyl-CoA reductase
MKDQVALIINGIEGSGTEICRQLFAKGAQIIATYSSNDNHETAKIWQAEQKRAGYNIHLQFLEINEIASICKVIKEIETAYNSIDILINNTDIIDPTDPTSADKFSIEEWQEALKMNLSGVFNVTRNVIQGMIHRNYGRVINISFLDKHKTPSERSNYTVSAGIHGFTKCLAQEVAPFGITVNTISSGYVEANLLTAGEETSKANGNSVMTTPCSKQEEVARVVCFLAEKASNLITGSNLNINIHHMQYQI